MMSAGQWIQQVALGWLVYELTSSSVMLGLLNGLRALPFFGDGTAGGCRRRSQGPTATDAAHAARADCNGLPYGRTCGIRMVQVWHIFVFTSSQE
jgi:hypothetical protein